MKFRKNRLRISKNNRLWEYQKTIDYEISKNNRLRVSERTNRLLEYQNEIIVYENDQEPQEQNL